MSGAIPLIPLYAFMVCTGTVSHFCVCVTYSYFLMLSNTQQHVIQSTVPFALLLVNCVSTSRFYTINEHRDP
jgi:hypothetical protein